MSGGKVSGCLKLFFCHSCTRLKGGVMRLNLERMQIRI